MKRALAAVVALHLAAAATCVRAQSPACLSDPARHAQLAEQDATQLHELQARHGARNVSLRTRAIFDRLIAAQQAADDASLSFDWRLAGYGSTAINAHAMHTGRIVVTQGLDSPDLPEEAIAASLAHEIAHVMGRHGLEQACFAVQVVYPSTLPSSLRQAQAALMQEVWSSGPELGNRVRSLTHAHELQADAQAIELLRRAGYPSDSMSRLLVLLQARQSANANWSFGSHPDHQLRIDKALEMEMQVRVRSQTAPQARSRRGR